MHNKYVTQGLPPHSSSLPPPPPPPPPPPVHRPLSGENRGHKMLVKMGWQEGQGLGKDNTGVAEPVGGVWVFVTTDRSQCSGGCAPI